MKKEDIDIEKKLLTLMLTNDDMLRIISEKTNKQFFYHDYCDELYELIIDYYVQYSSVPSEDSMTKILEIKYVDDINKIKEMSLFIKQLKKEKVDPQDVSFFIDQLRNYKLLRELLGTLDVHTQNIDVTNVREIYGKLEEDLVANRESSMILDLRRFEMNQHLEERLKRYSAIEAQNEIKIPSGYSEIDESIGGWRLSWLVVVTAESGAGKSITLLNLAENANKLGGQDVIYVSLEMPFEEYLDRYHSLITGIPHDIVRNKSFTTQQKRNFWGRIINRTLIPEQHNEFRAWFRTQSVDDCNLSNLVNEVDKRFTKVSQKMYFLDIPRNCTVSVIEKELRHIMKFCDPKVIIIDYINIMESLIKTGVPGQDHGLIARELKGLARELNVTILTASQMLITKDSKLGLHKVKYARMIAENADYVLMFKQTDEDIQTKRIRLRLVKHRHSEDMTISLRQEFETMKLSNYHEVDIT